MADTILIGRILPERRSFNLDAQRVSFRFPNHNVDAWLLFGVIDNQLTVKFSGKLGDLSDYMLKHIAAQAVQEVLDAVAFTTGDLFELELTGLLRDMAGRTDGSFDYHYFEPSDEVVAARKIKLTVNELGSLFATDSGIPVRRCMNDLHLALRHHSSSPFYCYRALETAKRHLGSLAGEVDDKKQWEHMRGALEIDRAKLEVVKKHADPLRHGGLATFDGAEWREIISITWDVMEAYFRFLLAHEKKLVATS